VASEGANLVVAESIVVAVVSEQRALVDIITSHTGPGVTAVASASEGSSRVLTRSLVSAIVQVTTAFVDVDARFALSSVAEFALTLE
jgi:hypothetical protein